MKTISMIAEEICVRMAENVGMVSIPTPVIVLPTGQGNTVWRMLTNVPSVALVRTMEHAGIQRVVTSAYVSTATLAETARSTRMTVLSTHA